MTRLENSLKDKLVKEYGKHKNSILLLRDKERELENKIVELEAKVDKLIKRYALVKNRS